VKNVNYEKIRLNIRILKKTNFLGGIAMPKWGKNAVDWQQRVDFDRLRGDRIRKGNEMLHKHGLGAAVVFNWDSRRWLTSAWSHPYEKHIACKFILFIRDAGFPYMTAIKGFDDQQLVEDSPWLEGRVVTHDVLSQPEIIKMRAVDDSRTRWKRTAQQIKSLMKQHNVDGLPIGIDYANPFMMQALMNEGMEVADGNAWILEADMVKTDDEIELMLQAAACNDAGYAALVEGFRPGMREYNAQALMAKGIYDAGAEYIEGWVVNSGSRTSPRTFNWSDRPVRPGELMSVEACHVNYCGYKVCYDRTFMVGTKPNDLQREVYALTAELHHRVMDMLKPGITTLDIDKTRPFPPKAFNSLEEMRQFRTTWYTNHFGGIGIRWEDAPSCTTEEPEIVIQKNMCLSYHAIHLVKDYQGVAIENTYRVTDNGCELMTVWPFDELTVLGMI